MTHLEDLQEAIITAELPDKDPCMSQAIYRVEAQGTEFFVCDYHSDWFTMQDDVVHPYSGPELCCKA